MDLGSPSNPATSTSSWVTRASRCEGLDGRRGRQGRTVRRGPRRGSVRLPPGLSREPTRGGLRLREVGRGHRRWCAHDVRPCGDRGRAGRPARPAVLVLLPVQRLHQQARGRLGDDASWSSPPPMRQRRSTRTRSRWATASTRVSRWPVGRPEAGIVDGTHPVVHAAAGSHANYFDDALLLGISAEQGFGCDDTRGPADDVSPAVAVIPSDPSAARVAFPWIGYQGRWGQREQSSTTADGSDTKPSWTHPDQHLEENGRDVGYAVPTGGRLGTSATDFFCGAVSGRLRGRPQVGRRSLAPARDPGAHRSSRGLRRAPDVLDPVTPLRIARRGPPDSCPRRRPHVRLALADVHRHRVPPVRRRSSWPCCRA